MLGDHLAVFAVAFATVVVATPITKRIAWRAGAVATPGERHIHTRPVPTIGGLAIFAGVLAGIAVASQLEGFDLVFRTTAEPEVVVLGALLIVVLGLVDDVRGVSAPAKLAGQILAAGALPLFGLAVQFVYVPGALGVVNLSPDLAALLTVVGILAMINAVNLIDGLDGLAAGVVLIAAAALFAYTQLNEAQTIGGTSAAPLVLAATAGACVGFLVYNFHPASIFMGDTGAMLLGLLLGASGASAISGTVEPGRGDFAAVTLPILVPALVLAIPFVDTVWTILRRLHGGRAIFSPDKEHLHHRLLEIGHSHRRAVLIMYYWSALLAFAGVGGSVLPRRAVLIVLGIGVGLAVVVALAGRVARALHLRQVSLADPDDRDEVVLSFTRGPRRRPKTGPDQRKRPP